MQVALAANFGHFGRPMKIARGRGGARASARGNTRMGTRAIDGIATCISQDARAVGRIPSLVLNKASPSSLTPTALTKKANWPATLAGYPSSAAVAKPFGSRGSLAACTTDNVHAGSVLVESSACHVALGMARAALQPELSRRSIVIASSSMMIRLHLTTDV